MLNDTSNQSQLDIGQYTQLRGKFPAKEQVKIYLLWKIHTKKLTIGSRIFYQDIAAHIDIARTTYNSVLEFFDGANLIVNEVVIADKVSQKHLERFRIVEENKSNN